MVNRAKGKGLIIKTMGPALEFAPSLIILKEEIDQAIKILDQCSPRRKRPPGAHKPSCRSPLAVALIHFVSSGDFLSSFPGRGLRGNRELKKGLDRVEGRNRPAHLLSPLFRKERGVVEDLVDRWPRIRHPGSFSLSPITLEGGPGSFPSPSAVSLPVFSLKPQMVGVRSQRPVPADKFRHFPAGRCSSVFRASIFPGSECDHWPLSAGDRCCKDRHSPGRWTPGVDVRGGRRYR